MAPTLRRGDRLLVTPLMGAPFPRPGEIVLVRRGNRLVAHRLLALKRGIAITRGDASPRPDPPLAFRDLLGRVVRVERSLTPARRLRFWLSHVTRNRRQR
jgi:signal peptidase I